MQTAVFAILGLICIVVGLLLVLILHELTYIGLGLAAFGILLISYTFIVDFRTIRRTITSRRGKFGTSTTIMLSAFIGIIVFVNAISVGGVNHRFYFNELAQFTLTSQTKDFLAKLDMPVTAICFFTPDDTSGVNNYSLILLYEYKYYSDKLTIRIVDPDAHPEEARKYGITSSDYYQYIIFETVEGIYPVSPLEVQYNAEHAFTNALLQVTGTLQKKIYFLTGHGEDSPSDALTLVDQTLKDNLLQVDTLDIAFTHAIPDDCATLIVVAPKDPMADEERQIIATYLENNGSVLFMTDPNLPDDIDQLVSPWGVDIGKGTIVDPGSYAAPDQTTPLITRLQNYWLYTTIYFPGATAIIPQETKPDGTDVTSIAWTTSKSWLETDSAQLASEPVYNEGMDTKGSLAVGVLITPSIEYDDEGNVTKFNTGPSIAIFGDSDFVNNDNFYVNDNSTLFIKAVNILTSSSDVMTIEHNVLQKRRLILSSEEATFLNISSIALLPLLVLIIGGIIWWQRR
ncbi:MAG: GldG family protein [Dehalococcoidales bacterium]|nr:GldG family protein [Dehalococcoidales bacterium]